MPEIERKFLVTALPEGDHAAEPIAQGYLAVAHDGVETRIRRRGDAATIKLVHADCKLPSGCTCAKTTARAPVARQ